MSNNEHIKWQAKSLDFVNNFSSYEQYPCTHELLRIISQHLAVLSGAQAVYVVQKVDPLTERVVSAFPDMPVNKVVALPGLFSYFEGEEVLCLPSIHLFRQMRILEGFGAAALFKTDTPDFSGVFLLLWDKPQMFEHGFRQFVETCRNKIREALKQASMFLSLQEMQEKFNLVFQTIPQGIVFIEERGRESWLNPKAREILGIQGTSDNVAVHVVADNMRRLREKAINSKNLALTAFELFENPGKSVEGWIWEFPRKYYSVSSFSTLQGGAKGRLWLFDDITKQHLAQLELLGYHRHLEKSYSEIKSQLSVTEDNLMAESQKSRHDIEKDPGQQREKKVIGQVSHDLKSPLNHILGFAQLLENQAPGFSDEQKKYIDLIRKIASDGLGLVQNLLDISAAGSLGNNINFEKIMIDKEVAAILEPFVFTAKQKNIGLHFNAHTPLAVTTDRVFVRRIVENLVSNAIKYSPSYSHVNISLFKDGAYVCFEVTDQGQGLTDDDKKEMFQPYKRLSARPTGGESSSGAGLYIVKELVEVLGGEIIVESEWQKGTVFRIYIPFAPVRISLPNPKACNS